MSGGRLTDETAVEIGIQISDMFGYLHCRNPPVIYRDLNSKLLKTVETMTRAHPTARVSLNSARGNFTARRTGASHRERP